MSNHMPLMREIGAQLAHVTLKCRPGALHFNEDLFYQNLNYCLAFGISCKPVVSWMMLK